VVLTQPRPPPSGHAPRLYDCIVDTHLLGIHGAAEMVLDMAERVCVTRPEVLPEAAAATPAVTEAPASPAAEPPRTEAQLLDVRGEKIHIRPMGSGDGPRLPQF